MGLFGNCKKFWVELNLACPCPFGLVITLFFPIILSVHFQLVLCLLIVIDGDHPLEPIEDQPTSLGDSTSTKEVKEFHAMVLEVINHVLHMLPSSARI